jgi:hypothetical protein
VSDEEIQLAEVVKSSVVPSEKFPVALSCTVVPLAIEELCGFTVIEVRIADVTVTVVEPVTPA